MAKIPWARSKEDGLNVLDKFGEHAHNLTYRKYFQNAVEFAFGREFVIQQDLSGRMVFFCIPCAKEMNNIKGLIDHSNSGSHLKCADSSEYSCITETRKEQARQYNRDTIQYEILKSKVEILGIRFLEQYICSHHCDYYKCILCGAHGKLNDMVHHMKGNSHNEKYMKSAVRVNFSILDTEDKMELRHQLFKTEGLNMEEISIMKGRDLYPFQWLAEGRRAPKQKIKTESKYKPESEKHPWEIEDATFRNKNQQRMGSPLLFSSDYDSGYKKGSLKREMKNEPHFSEGPNLFDLPLTEVFRNPSPPSPPPPAPVFDNMESPSSSSSTSFGNLKKESMIISDDDESIISTRSTKVIKDFGVTSVSIGIQAFSIGAWEDFCLRLNFLIKTSRLQSTDIKCDDDEMAMITLAFELSKLYYFAYRNVLQDQTEHITPMQKRKECRDTDPYNQFLKGILGKLQFIRVNIFTRLPPSLTYPVVTEWL